MQDITEAEIARRQAYWAVHWQEFACQVVVQTPRTANAHVGAFAGHLFGSLPVPVHTMDVDRGTFRIEGDFVYVYGQYKTYRWYIPTTSVQYAYDGSEVRMCEPNKAVITILGPVAAPLAGAYHAHGIEIN